MVTVPNVTEADVAGLMVGASSAATSELDVAVVAVPPSVPRVSELDVSALAIPETDTVSGVSELDVAALVFHGVTATRRCQVWKISRRDGRVFAFTSHDEPVSFVGVSYQPCKSLASSASESSSELNSVGSVEINGMLNDASITQGDIYAGLFEDAVVDIWVVPWDGQPDDQAPFRLGGGNIGKLTRMEHAFTAEILGPGGRLQQAALVDFFTPGCRWTFGVLDADGIGCPVNVTDFRIDTVVVTSQVQRTLVSFDAVEPSGNAIWNGGKVNWLTGRNAGVSCQVDTVDFSGPILSLWDPAPYPPEAGDTFSLDPGCPKTKPACQQYGVYISFGGFDDIPGPDALQSNADSLFTGS